MALEGVFSVHLVVGYSEWSLECNNDEYGIHSKERWYTAGGINPIMNIN